MVLDTGFCMQNIGHSKQKKKMEVVLIRYKPVVNSGYSTFLLALAMVSMSLKSTNSNLCLGIIKSSSSTFSTDVEFEKLIKTGEDTGLRFPVGFFV